MKITAENVVQQIKLKNEEAITFLISSYGGLLKAIVKKYLNGNQQDIEECLSDVIVSIWYHIESFDASKNEFKQWIAAIAKYRALDYVRKGEKSKKFISNVEFDEKVYRQPAEEQIQYDISYLLNELSDTEQTIFKKYYVDGVPSREIATQFYKKESWVHNKLSRGRKKLKTILLKGEV